MHSTLACVGKKLVHVDNGNIAKFLKEKNTVVWTDIEKPDKKDKELLSKVFGFHPLAIDDCAHFTHLPKVDDFKEYIFIVFHRIFFDKKTKTFKLVELDIFHEVFDQNQATPFTLAQVGGVFTIGND